MTTKNCWQKTIEKGSCLGAGYYWLSTSGNLHFVLEDLGVWLDTSYPEDVFNFTWPEHLDPLPAEGFFPHQLFKG